MLCFFRTGCLGSVIPDVWQPHGSLQFVILHRRQSRFSLFFFSFLFAICCFFFNVPHSGCWQSVRAWCVCFSSSRLSASSVPVVARWYSVLTTHSLCAVCGWDDDQTRCCSVWGGFLQIAVWLRPSSFWWILISEKEIDRSSGSSWCVSRMLPVLSISFRCLSVFLPPPTPHPVSPLLPDVPFACPQKTTQRHSIAPRP